MKLILFDHKQSEKLQKNRLFLRTNYSSQLRTVIVIHLLQCFVIELLKISMLELF